MSNNTNDLNNLKIEQIIRVCSYCQLPAVPEGMYPSHGNCRECFLKSEYAQYFSPEEIEEMDFVKV